VEHSTPVDDEAPGQETVLLVDDEPSVREVAQEILEAGGYTVVTADNGRAALEIFAQRRSDIACIVLDFAMPHLDGVDTLQEIRRAACGAPILLTSGYAESDIRHRCAGLEPCAFIAKPFEMATLLAAVRRALRGKVPEPPPTA
jgi:two-component system cell cycle sensor histidine kinase/response regulator CckA